MRRTDICRFSFFAFLTVLMSASAIGAAPAGWQKIDVLDHRLSLNAPAGTQRVAKEGTRLSRPGEQIKSDHLDVDDAGMPLRLVATEMLLRTDTLTETTLSAASPLGNKSGAPVAGPVTVQGTLHVASFPALMGTSLTNGYLVASTVLLGPDKHLLRLDIYAQSEAAARSDAAQKTAAAIGASALAGPRRLNAGKGVKLLGGELTIDLLDGYTTVVETRENASVVNIVEIASPGAPVSAAIMYVGHNVRPSAPSYPVESLSLFGRKGTWSRAPSDGTQIERTVWLLSATDPEDEPQVQFRIMAANVAREQALLQMVKSIRSRSLH